MAIPLVVVSFALAFGALNQNRGGQVKLSEFGKYQGYNQGTYDGYKRFSDYMTLSDGTRVAYDLLLPTKNGTPPRQAVAGALQIHPLPSGLDRL